MKYAITRTKIIHAVTDKDVGGYWDAICGKWISPVEVYNHPPDGVRMCAQCKRKLEKERS